MKTLRYAGEDGQHKHNDVPLKHGQLLEVPDHEVEGYVASGVFLEQIDAPSEPVAKSAKKGKG